MKRDLALLAVKMAIAIRRPLMGCIHYRDCGSQYCAHDYQKLLGQHGFKVSPFADVWARIDQPFWWANLIALMVVNDAIYSSISIFTLLNAEIFASGGNN